MENNLPDVLLTPEAIEYYYDNPIDFVDDNILSCIRESTGKQMRLTKQQMMGMNAVRDHYRVGIESGHGTGKSFLFFCIGTWFLVTRFNTLGQKIKVPCVAPTYHQLYDVLWPEFKTWLPQSRLYPLFDVRNDEIFLREHKDTMFIRARSPREPDNLQGYHAPHLLWIADEAFGITNDQSWEMIEGSMTEEDNRIIFGGQHSLVVGYCHDAFHSDKENWYTLRFSSEDSPIAVPAYAQRIARKFGRNSDVYRIRVLGMEPKGNPQALIQMSRAEAARHREVQGKGVVRMGVDCARFGDDLTVVTTAHGYKVFPQAILEKSDTYDIYNLIVAEAKKYRKLTGYQGKIECRIDTTGGYGAGAFDMLLRDTENNIVPIAINFGGEGDDEYADIVSRMWGSLEKQIDEMELPDDDFLIEEVGTRRIKQYDKHGRIQIEPKSDYKDERKGYGQSPDRSDSLVLCVFTEHWKRRVWEFFSRDMMVGMSIGWNNEEQKMHNLHYGALVLGEDMSVSLLCALWDQRRGYLYVYGALRSTDPSPVAIVPRMASMMHLRGFKVDKLLGNDLLFENKGAKPVSRMINKHLQQVALREHRLKPAMKYDEYGSMVDVGQLFKLRKIFVEKGLEDVAEEIQYWCVEKGEPQPMPGYCKALCLISSELRRVKEIQKVLVPILRDYANKELVEKIYDEAKDAVKGRKA